MEHEPDIARSLRSALQTAGLASHVAGDGDTGLAALRQGGYRVLLIDLRLPKGAGFAVLRALQEDQSVRPPVILALSAPDQASAILRAMQMGADDYVPKPIDTRDLMVRVALWLQRIESPVLDDRPELRVHSFGHFRVENAGRLRLHEGRRARKVGTLFKYLLTNQGRVVPTGEVLELLWPEIPEDQATISLHSLLYQLRRTLGYPAHGASCLVHTRTTLSLHLSENDWWDVTRFRAHVAEGARRQLQGEWQPALDAYSAAVTVYAGDYLAEDRYEDWAHNMREELKAEWLRALGAMAQLHAERAEYEQQETLLRTVLREDPYHEPAYRALFGLLVSGGRGAEAQLLYRRLVELLRGDFGVLPSPATQALVAQLMPVATPI